MKDIPVFTTEHGAASLVLREIPYRQSAYITIHDTLEPAMLLEECVKFCRMCGAERIFATGHSYLERFHIAATAVQMHRPKSGLAADSAVLIPVTAETAAQWREISNSAMASVSISAYLTSQDEKALAADGDAYFAEKDGTLIGIGKASGDTVHTVVSLVPGMGEAVLRALASTLNGEIVRLTVADNNQRAIRLYDRLGFEKTGKETVWYQVQEEK